MLLPLCASAHEGDFDPGHTGWNGLSELAELAQGMGMAVQIADALDLEAADAQVTTLLLFAPLSAPDPAALLRFLRRGGRVLIADDFALGEPLLAALQIDRSPNPLAATDDRYRDNPNLPVARPSSSGPLVDGVDHVVTNHPAYLRSRLPPVLQVASALDAVAVAGELPAGKGGAGRFVALSDPSVLINNMLAFPGNLAFARNLLSWLGRPGGRLVVLSGEFALWGDARPSGRERLALLELHREFNAFVGGLSAIIPSRGVLRAMAVLLALGLGWTLVFVMRLPRKPPAGPFAVRR